MTFKDQMTADMVHLMDADYFGSTATYVDPAGQETELTLVLFEEHTESPDSNGITTKLRIRDAAWPAATIAEVNLRAKVQIDGVDWAISQLLHRDEYQVTVRLERHELHEHTRPEYRRR